MIIFSRTIKNISKRTYILYQLFLQIYLRGDRLSLEMVVTTRRKSTDRCQDVDQRRAIGNYRRSMEHEWWGLYSLSFVGRSIHMGIQVCVLDYCRHEWERFWMWMIRSNLDLSFETIFITKSCVLIFFSLVNVCIWFIKRINMNY